MADHPRSAPKNQEEAVFLEAFASEIDTGDDPASTRKIASSKATEVALLAFSPEQDDRNLAATSTGPITFSSVFAPEQAPSATAKETGRGYQFPGGRRVLTMLVCGVAVAATAMLMWERGPAESVAGTPVTTGEGAVTDASMAPATSPSAASAGDEPLPLKRPAIAPRLDQTAVLLRSTPARVNQSPQVPLEGPAAAPASTPRPGFLGSLSVNSSPEGATVFVNGVAVGATPLVLSDVAAGSRVVRVELAGYERWSSAVRIIASEDTRVDVQLRPSPIR